MPIENKDVVIRILEEMISKNLNMSSVSEALEGVSFDLYWVNRSLFSKINGFLTRDIFNIGQSNKEIKDKRKYINKEISVAYRNLEGYISEESSNLDVEGKKIKEYSLNIEEIFCEIDNFHEEDFGERLSIEIKTIVKITGRVIYSIEDKVYESSFSI